MKILISWLILTLEILAIAYILGGVKVDGFFVAIVVALFVGILNAVVKPILKIITLPINILTLGIFSFILNTVLILIIAYVIPGFSIEGFLWGALFNLILSITTSVIGVVFKK